MQNNYSFQLSNYQSAVLTEMGIIPWQSRTLKADSGANSCSKTQSDTDSSKKLSNPIQSLRDTVKSDNHAAVVEKDNHVVVSLPEHIVIIFDDWNQSSRLAQDIISALALNDKPLHIVGASESKQQFSDYALIWQQGDRIALENNILTTPRLNLLQAPTKKRLLWQLLSDYAG